MDFFEAQARAKQRTSRLLVLFVLAVVGTILAGYGAALLLVAKGSGRLVLWQPGLFAAVAAGTETTGELVLIDAATLVETARIPVEADPRVVIEGTTPGTFLVSNLRSESVSVVVPDLLASR